VRPGRLAAAVLAALLIGAAVVVAVSVGGDDPRPAPSVSPSASPSNPAVEAYARDVQPLLEEGGKVVELGIKPALADYASGKETEAELALESRSWISALRGVERRIRALTVPPEVADAHTTYLRALERYVVVARRLQRASADPDSDRRQVVAEVTRLGEAADRTYDEAAALVDAAR
jgi:hypothetical protein